MRSSIYSKQSLYFLHYYVRKSFRFLLTSHLKPPFLWRHNCFWIVNRNVSVLGLYSVHCSHVLSGKSERIPFVLLINHLQCRRGIHSLNITYTNPEQQVKTGSYNCNCLLSHFNIFICYFLKRGILLPLSNLSILGIIGTMSDVFNFLRIQKCPLYLSMRTKKFHNVPAF